MFRLFSCAFDSEIVLKASCDPKNSSETASEMCTGENWHMTDKERRNPLELQIEKYVVLGIYAYYMLVFSIATC